MGVSMEATLQLGGKSSYPILACNHLCASVGHPCPLAGLRSGRSRADDGNADQPGFAPNA